MADRSRDPINTQFCIDGIDCVGQGFKEIVACAQADCEHQESSNLYVVITEVKWNPTQPIEFNLLEDELHH